MPRRNVKRKRLDGDSNSQTFLGVSPLPSVYGGSSASAASSSSQATVNTEGPPPSKVSRSPGRRGRGRGSARILTPKTPKKGFRS